MKETKSLRQFGLIMAGAFLFLGVALPLLKGHEINKLLMAASGVFFLLALLIPNSLRQFRNWWMKLGEVLGAINAKILFTLIFFILFTPIHYVFRLIRRDRFKRKWKAYDSTFVQKMKLSNFSDPF